MFSIETVTTAAFAWSCAMFMWMLVNMVPRVEVWNWRGLLQDVSVVGLVGILAFMTGVVSLRRILDLPPSVTTVAITLMAIVLTPIAVRVHQKARGK